MRCFEPDNSVVENAFSTPYFAHILKELQNQINAPIAFELLVIAVLKLGFSKCRHNYMKDKSAPPTIK